MQLRYTLIQNVLISLLVATSSSAAAQVNDPIDSQPDVGQDIGPGTDAPQDMPDEALLREYLDPPTIAVDENYGPPEAPKKVRKKAMEALDPPVLKEGDPNRLPVHDVRKDVGGTSTEWKLEELKLLYKRMLNPDKSENGVDPEVVKESYYKLYRELDDEQRAARSKGIREPAGPIKNEILRQSRAINNVLTTMPAPPKKETKSANAYNLDFNYNADFEDYGNALEDLQRTDIELDVAKRDAQQAINKADREKSYANLEYLRRVRGNTEQEVEDAEKTLKRLLNNGKLEGALIAELRASLQETKKKHQDFQKFMNAYEEAIYRKWPVVPPQKPEAPDIGPLPEVIGSPVT